MSSAIVESNDIIDFGKVADGEIVTKTFTLPNKHNAILKVIGTGASCGCTKPSVAETILQPGEETTVTIEFNSKGKKGLNKKNVYIQYTIQNKPYILYQYFTANVV